MRLHDLKKSAVGKKRVGRGGKRGTTSGRGTKGQSARSGHKLRPESRDIIKKIPKLRGYRFASIQKVTIPVNMEILDKKYTAGESVTEETLQEKGIIKKHGGKVPAVKILATGELSKALNFKGVPMSESAKVKIEKVGGKVEK